MAHIEAKYGGILVILAYGRFLFTTHSDSKIRAWNVSGTNNYFKPKKAITLPQKRTFINIKFLSLALRTMLLISFCTRVLGIGLLWFGKFLIRFVSIRS